MQQNVCLFHVENMRFWVYVSYFAVCLRRGIFLIYNLHTFSVIFAFYHPFCAKIQLNERKFLVSCVFTPFI